MLEEPEHSKESILTIREAAQLLRVSQRTIRRWIADGRLPASRLSSRLIRIYYHDIVALMDSCRIAPDDGGQPHSHETSSAGTDSFNSGQLSFE
jgi:excisionase family DNA binding protein